jgi:hypothetical protein
MGMSPIASGFCNLALDLYQTKSTYHNLSFPKELFKRLTFCGRSSIVHSQDTTFTFEAHNHQRFFPTSTATSICPTSPSIQYFYVEVSEYVQTFLEDAREKAIPFTTSIPNSTEDEVPLAELDYQSQRCLESGRVYQNLF